ncbi:MAG TPA: hypothetical protein VM283_07375, partial [Armatimonadota bacterium]|nr:hypothetical protein [Armatimonadota bacterium]
VRVLDENGAELPAQVITTGTHQDGSVRWLLLDLQADVPAGGRTLTLEYGDGVRRTEPPVKLAVTDAPGAISVNTGALQFSILKDRFNFLDALTLDGDPVIKPGHDGGPYFVDDQGHEFRAVLDPDPEIEIELAGPLRSVITARGWYVSEAGEQKCRFIVRIHAFAGRPFVKVLYTWLMTEDSRELRFRDIGLRVPKQADGCTFALDDGSVLRYAAPENYTADLVQYDFDKFRPLPDGPREGGPQPVGVITAYGAGSSVSLAVRDFRQLFPKELSYSPQGITFHMWPAHGVANPDRPVTDAALQYLWFCHEGPVLDFQVPESYYTHSEEYSEYEYRYVRSSQNANAIGIAKTHELLVSFAGQSDAAAVAKLSGAFQDPPEAMASPEWMCASGVFGAIQAASPEQFPEYEALISGNFDAERRMQDFTRDWGMWNFGDGHTSWDMTRRRWSDAYRCWRNTHHGSPRVPWVLYARSGDPKYLRYGIRSARHIMDEDFCHWTNEQFEALDYPQGKIKGALNDYKGLVHWHSGNRLTDYNSMTDFMLWYWHMTGDRWGLEVAQDWGEAIKARYGSPFGHREGAGTCSALIELYLDTRDQRYFEIADEIARHLISTQLADGSFPQWENYAPWLERYCELTGSEEAKAALVRWADAYLAGYGDSFSSYHVGGELATLGYAYRYSGDVKYLARAKWLVEGMIGSVYRGDDELLAGFMQAGQTSLGGYGMQRLPVFMRALVEYGKPIEPDMLVASRPGFAMLFERTRPEIDGKQTKIETLEAWVLEGTDQPFTVTIHTRHSYDQRNYYARVVAPDGAEVTSFTEQVPRGERDFSFAIPADGKTGIYRVSLGGEGSYGQFADPVEVEPGMPVAFPLGNRLLTRDRGGYFFFVPEGVTRLALSMRVIDATAPGVQISSPDEETEVQSTVEVSDQPQQVCEVQPDPGQTGAAWKLYVGGAVSALAFESDGATVPPILFKEAYPPDVCQTFAAALANQ